MAQYIRPLFGAPANDSEIARSVGLPAGVYEGLEPSITGAGGEAGWTASLGVDTRHGRSLWRTQGDFDNGRYAIEESATVTFVIEEPDATHPRIDLLIGYHKWVEGEIDAITLKPLGTILTEQRPNYAVVKGTPAASPVDPTVADPYNVGGARAVILARVYVPVSDPATIERYAPTDLRLEYMRALCEEVVDAKAPYNTLKERLDAMTTNQETEMAWFEGTTANTGTPSNLVDFTPSLVRFYGAAINRRSATTFGLTKAGIYELLANHKIEGAYNDSASTVEALLHYTDSNQNPWTVYLDMHSDTNSIEVSQTLYSQLIVDESWTDVYVDFSRGGWPAGSFRGSIKYLGTPSSLESLAIATGDQSFFESVGQTYPDDATATLNASNAVGAVTWSVVSGSNLLDGNSEPKAEIVNDNQLKITWATQPGSFPATYSVKLQVVDSASTPRTVQKTITITLATPQALAINNPNVGHTATSYPSTVTFAVLGSGGLPPYTWAIVAGEDTTLTGAAYANGFVTGTVSSTDTKKVRLRLTDDASTQVEKVINILVSFDSGGGGGGGGCVPEGTMIATPAGEVSVEQIKAGDVVSGFDDITLEPVLATVKQVFVYEDREMVSVGSDLGTIKCSADHRLWRKLARKTTAKNPHWPPASELMPGDRTLYHMNGEAVETTITSVDSLPGRETVYHMALDRGHCYVAGGFIAHNLKIAPPSFE